jgi:hypothetical protein
MLDLAIRTTVILAMAWAVSLTQRRAAAATRHLILHAAVVAVLLSPLLSAIAPRFQLPGLPSSLRSSGGGSELLSLDSLRSTPRVGTAEPSKPDPGASRGATGVSWIEQLGFMEPSRFVPVVWLSGSLLCGLWFALGWMGAARAVRRAAHVDPAWQIELSDLCRKLRIGPEVRLRLVPNHTSPVVTGLFTPSVLLPLRSRDWDAERRRSVLLHELAHVQRGDCRVQALAQAACAMYWFNPLMWMTFARLRVERERACDDRVLLSGLTPSTYATHLL